MSEELFLSRVTLRRDAPIAALREVFHPEKEEPRTIVGHKLIWTLFGDTADRTRDFLWREAGNGRFYILSRRAPQDRHKLFKVDPPKTFSLRLTNGDRLRFSLRANATVARRTDGSPRGKPSDVVMDVLHKLERGRERAEARSEAVQTAGLAWLARQGMTHGFSLGGTEKEAGPTTARVVSHRTLRLDRRRASMKIGILDFEGEVTVTDAPRLVDAIGRGFGRAKAFGCGLMLVRRP